MNTIYRYLTLLAPIVVLLSSCQQKPYPIFFLSEARSTEGSTSKFILMYNGRPYTRMPIVTHENFKSYHSFMDMQDGSYGIVLTLKDELINRLYSISVEKEGMLILPVVNGLAFQPVRIDRPFTDGKLVIWGGLNGYDLMQIARDIKPENEEMEKKRFMRKNPRPLPKLDPKQRNQKRDYTGRTIGEIFPSRAQ